MNNLELKNFKTFLENKEVIRRSLSNLFDENEIAVILSMLIMNTEKIESAEIHCCNLSDMKDRLKETTLTNKCHFSIKEDLIKKLEYDHPKCGVGKHEFMTLKTNVNGIRNCVNVDYMVKDIVGEIDDIEMLETEKFSVFHIVDNTLYVEVADDIYNSWIRRKGWKAWDKLCNKDFSLSNADIDILFYK